MKHYVYDFTGEGYTEISEIDLHNEKALIGTTDSYEEAVELASEYEDKIQYEIDKVTGNEEDDEEEYFDPEEDLMEQKKDYYNNNATLTF